MKLNIFLSFYLFLGCWLFINCQNVPRNFEQLDNSSNKVLDEVTYPKELLEYVEKNRNKRDTNMNDRSFKILENFYPDEGLPNLNNKTSAGPNNIGEMENLKNADYLSQPFSEDKNQNFSAKILLESELEGKAYKNTKSSKHFNKANRIRRESPQIFRYDGSTETKKRISSAEKFLKLGEKERELLLEKVFNEIKRKLNRPEHGNGCIDNDESVKMKPQLLVLNSKSKQKREKRRETELPVLKAVENPYSSKTDTETLSDSFNDDTETVISADLKTNPGISSIGSQTGRNIEHFTTNSENFSKEEDAQYQTDGIDLTTFVPEGSEQKDETITDQLDNIQSKYTPFSSGNSVKQKNKNGQPQLYQILRNPLETNRLGQSKGPSGSFKMTERVNKNYEDGELMEYIKNNVKNCLREMSKDTKEEQEKPEPMGRNKKDETNSDTNQTEETKENYPKGISSELIKQLSLIDKLNNLNPNSLGFQLLWNILRPSPSNPNFLLGGNQKTYGENAGSYKFPLITEENYLDEASSEETGNDSYDMSLQNDLKNLNDFVRTYTKPNMEATRFDQFLYLLDDIL